MISTFLTVGLMFLIIAIFVVFAIKFIDDEKFLNTTIITFAIVIILVFSAFLALIWISIKFMFTEAFVMYRIYVQKNPKATDKYKKSMHWKAKCILWDNQLENEHNNNVEGWLTKYWENI